MWPCAGISGGSNGPLATVGTKCFVLDIGFVPLGYRSGSPGRSEKTGGRPHAPGHPVFTPLCCTPGGVTYKDTHRCYICVCVQVSFVTWATRKQHKRTPGLREYIENHPLGYQNTSKIITWAASIHRKQPPRLPQYTENQPRGYQNTPQIIPWATRIHQNYPFGPPEYINNKPLDNHNASNIAPWATRKH